MEQQFASLDIYGRNKQSISVKIKTEVEENCYMETTQTPLGTIGYAIPEENKDQQVDVVLMELPVRQSFIKLEDSELLFSVLSNDVNVDMSPQGQKEQKYIKLLFNIKYGTNPQKETAWRVLAQEAREFDSMTLMNPILRLLRQLTWEDEGERNFLVGVIVSVLSEFGPLVYPHVSSIFVLVQPSLIRQDYKIREAGTMIIYNISKAVGPETMVTLMRSGIDSRYADEHVKNVTAITLSVVASALGVPALLPFLMEIGMPALLPFLKYVCQSNKLWQVRCTGIKIVQEIAYSMGCAIYPRLRSLLENIEHGCKDENQEVKNITALALAEIATIESSGKPFQIIN